MSLNQINHNAVSGRPSLGAPVVPILVAPRPGLESLKRSQSVRTSGIGAGRKSSWPAGSNGLAKRSFTPAGMIDIAEDKENAGQAEFDESNSQVELYAPPTQPSSRRTSAMRSSYAPSTAESDSGSVVTTTAPNRSQPNSAGGDSFISFSDAGENNDESRRVSSSNTDLSASRRESGIDHDDDTISMTDSAVASLIANRVRERIEAGELDDLSEEEEDIAPLDPDLVLLHSAPQGVHVVDYAEKHGMMGRGMSTPADSGLGSDLPTAALGSEFGGYFPLDPNRESVGVGAE